MQGTTKANVPPLIAKALVATLTIDGLALLWINAAEAAVMARFVFVGMMFGQLSALATWAVLGSHPWGERMVILAIGFTAAIALNYGILPESGGARIPEVLAVYGIHTSVAFALACVLQWTRFCEPWRGRRDGFRAQRYSLGRMLGWITLVAVAAAVARNAELPYLSTPRLVWFFAGTGGVTLLTLVVMSWPVPTPLRLIPIAAGSVLLASIVSSLEDTALMIGLHLALGFSLAVWLGLWQNALPRQQRGEPSAPR